jgi:hypothetical protein
LSDLGEDASGDSTPLASGSIVVEVMDQFIGETQQEG